MIQKRRDGSRLTPGRVIAVVISAVVLMAGLWQAAPATNRPDLPEFPSEGVDQPEQSGLLRFAASDDGTVVFASGASGTTSLPVLYRSTDGGHSWNRVGDDSLANAQRQRSFSGGLVLVSPTYRVDKRVFSLSGEEGIWRSDDGGELFTPASQTIASSAVLSPEFASGDERIFVASRPPAAYDDETRLTTPMAFVPPSPFFGGIAIGPDFAITGEVLLGGALYDDAETPVVFTCVRFGCEPRTTLPDLPQPPKLLVSAASPNIVFAWTNSRLYRSRDGGYTFAPHPVPAGFTVEDMAQGNGRLFLLGQSTSASTSGVLVSNDKGMNWTPLGKDTALGERARALVALPDNRLIASPGEGFGLLCSADGGVTWAIRCPPRRH